MQTMPFNAVDCVRAGTDPVLLRIGAFALVGRWLFRTVKVACLALTLSGCATTRYVTVPCLTHDQTLPAEPPKVKDRLTGQADKDLTIVAGSAVRLRAWGHGLNHILEGCREPRR